MSKPFCTLDIPSVEAAAFLAGLLNPNPTKYSQEGVNEALEEAWAQGTMGGGTSFRYLAQHVNYWGLRDQLRPILFEAGFDLDKSHNMWPPWLTPQAPEKIDTYDISYNKDGVKFGCEDISLETMEAMVKRCKEKGE